MDPMPPTSWKPAGRRAAQAGAGLLDGDYGGGGTLWEEDARTSGRAKGTASIRPPKAEWPWGKALSFPPAPQLLPPFHSQRKGVCIALFKAEFYVNVAMGLRNQQVQLPCQTATKARRGNRCSTYISSKI